MSPKDRAVFVAAYSRLVAEVWADPARERALEQDSRALLASYGLTVPDEVAIDVVRDTGDAEPDLEVQVRQWEQAEETGRLVLIVPAIDPVSAADLVEHELDAVVAGLDSGCACCCPCCCTT
jgi:hypothetical protein